ncbi:MAG: twin-arginine translocation signal domain-containing protein [Betaproteobacteria bacterium]|nr:twin-arginine translocation signal domain-containing protein [Betaproteobacteria bacterium]
MDRDSKLSRRNFLLAVGAGGAATAAALTVRHPPQLQPSTSGTGKRATQGYTASEHINSYYRTTKV